MKFNTVTNYWTGEQEAGECGLGGLTGLLARAFGGDEDLTMVTLEPHGGGAPVVWVLDGSTLRWGVEGGKTQGFSDFWFAEFVFGPDEEARTWPHETTAATFHYGAGGLGGSVRFEVAA